MNPEIYHLQVSRTARYFVLGDKKLQPHTLVFVLHGYGMQASLFIKEFETLSKPGVWIIAPEGLSRFYKKGFSGDVVASWMTKEERQHEIQDYINYLDELHQNISNGNNMKTVLIGFSQGSAAASRWLCMGTCRIDELVLWCGEFPEDITNLPGPLPPVQYVYALRDEFIPIDRFEYQTKLLREKGFIVKVHTFNGTHQVDQEALQQVSRAVGI